MVDKPIDHSLPGSFVIDALSSPLFEQAINAGIKEAIDTQDIQTGIDCFKERAQANGLALNVLFALILELARPIIKWYFDQNESKKYSA